MGGNGTGHSVFKYAYLVVLSFFSIYILGDSYLLILSSVIYVICIASLKITEHLGRGGAGL